jgi:ADP-dependent NAD(P)H-hydrate dehydratase / NAD(P)H-hydrate epimerase
MHEYWQKQTGDKPLFPDLLWSRPENRAFAGKLLIIGGNLHGFAAPAESFGEANKAGIGVAHVVLPDMLTKTVGKLFPEAEFVPSTPSGSFAQKALGELLPAAGWADGVLLAGDFGRNSETAILLEKFAGKHVGQLTIAGDAADYFLATPAPVLDRPDTLLALNFTQLQKLAIAAHHTQAFTSRLDLLHFIEALHGFSLMHPAFFLVDHLEHTFVAVDGKVSSVPDTAGNILKPATHAVVWWLQNPGKSYEAISTALVA